MLTHSNLNTQKVSLTLTSTDLTPNRMPINLTLTLKHPLMPPGKALHAVLSFILGVGLCVHVTRV